MEHLLDLLGQLQTYVSFISLLVLVLALDVDNVVFMSILTSGLPPETRRRTNRHGLFIGIALRVTLLFLLGFIAKLDANLLTVLGVSFDAKSLILLGGGLFLIVKSTLEIHKKVEGNGLGDVPKPVSLGRLLVQLTLLNLVFSLDSVITAMGMVGEVPIMVAALTTSMLVMFIFAKAIGEFVQRHPTIKILALSFLLLIGVLLLAEAIHVGIPKGYIYFAIAFSLGIELLNMRYRKRQTA